MHGKFKCAFTRRMGVLFHFICKYKPEYYNMYYEYQSRLFPSISLRDRFVSKEQLVIYLAKEVLSLSEQLSAFDNTWHNVKRLCLTSETVYLQGTTGKKNPYFLLMIKELYYSFILHINRSMQRGVGLPGAMQKI